MFMDTHYCIVTDIWVTPMYDLFDKYQIPSKRVKYRYGHNLQFCRLGFKIMQRIEVWCHMSTTSRTQVALLFFQITDATYQLIQLHLGSVLALFTNYIQFQL